MSRTPDRIPPVLLLGASGATGTIVAQELRQRSRAVIAAVRPGSKTAAGVPTEVVAGLYAPVLRALIDRYRTSEGLLVACVVGQRRRTRSPWSGLLSPPDLLTATMRSLVAAARPGMRIVAVSAHGVGDSWMRAGPVFRWLVRHSKLSIAFGDANGMEQALARSSIPFSIIRPVLLTNGRAREWESFAGSCGSFASVARSAVADAVIAKLEEPAGDHDVVSIRSAAKPRGT
jgi:hypothetical protein